MVSPIRQAAEDHRTAVTLYQQGRYAEALPIAERVVECLKATLRPLSAETAAALNTLAAVCTALGRFDESEKHFREVVLINRFALGGHHPGFAVNLGNLAFLLYQRGNYSESEQLYRQAIGILRESFGENHPDFATAVNGLATVLDATGRYEEAEPLYRQGLEIDRVTKGEQHPDYATSLNNLAALLQATGRYEEAETLFTAAMHIRRRALGTHHPQFAESVHNLAIALEAMGRYDEAEPLHRQALAVSRLALGERHPSVARCLNTLAACLNATGRFDKAEPLLRQAVDIFRSSLGESHHDTLLSVNNLAFLFHATGRPEWAADLYSGVLASYEKAHSEAHVEHDVTLSNLAFLLQTRGRHQEAEPLLRRALTLALSRRGECHPTCALFQNNLALLLQDMGRYEEAESLHRQALDIRRRRLPGWHPDLAQSLNNLAVLLVCLGRVDESVVLKREAFRIEDRVIARVWPVYTDSQRVAFLAQPRATLAGFLSFVTRYLTGDPAAAREALDIVLRRKALTAESQSALHRAVRSGKYPHLRELLARWHSLQRQVARRTLEGPRPGETAARHRESLAAIQGDADRLETDLAAQVPEVRLQKQLQAADRRAVALHLPEGVALVEFVRFEVFDFHAVPARGEPKWKPAHYLAFILPSGRPEDVSMIDLGEADPIDALIESFRDSVEQGGDGRRAVSLLSHSTDGREHSLPALSGIALRKLVFDPLLSALAGCTRLLIAPDGGLTRLPFEILPADAVNTCLIDTYRITYTPTGRDLLRLAEPAAASTRPPVILGDADFDLDESEGFWSRLRGRLARFFGRSAEDLDSRVSGRRSVALEQAGLTFCPLPGTRTEAVEIARLLGVAPVLGRYALEIVLKSTRAPRILHLATHGFFLDDQEVRHTHGLEQKLPPGYENPLLRSGLALAGANWRAKNFTPPTDAEDGMLTAQDVTGLDLTGTELVVLSACDTGLGKVHSGEGVFGLRRSFIQAGARTLVMSLWKVPDEQTQELMIDFYRRILAGEPRGEALRQAQLSMKAKHPEPRYWGAFICQGDTGKLARFSTTD